MPKKSRTKIARGEHNPRHFILLPIGVGNMYCRNCDGLDEDDDGEGYCRIFLDEEKEYTQLKRAHYGSVRCDKCKAAEKDLEKLKQQCREDGYQSGAASGWRPN